QLESYQGLVEDAKAYGAGDTGLAADKLATLIGKEILSSIDGVISTEIDARLSYNTQATVERGRRLIKLYSDIGISSDKILLKIAGTWEGIQAAKTFEQEGIHCNITLLFCMAQAKAAADINATLISPFVGRITDWYKAHDNVEHYTAAQDPGVQSVKAIYQYYKGAGFNTIVMGASFRNIEQVKALAGCDKLTISPTLLDELKQSDAVVSQQLGNCDALSKEPISESEFRFEIASDNMANEKLAQGIQAFVKDQETLEEKLKLS
ncbi:MAG: transaldolase, partial [Sinobacterium sp.]|nr:transaldolase [Sinobacterium sp.]